VSPSPQDGQGVVRIAPIDPVPAGSRGTWTVEWIAGEAGLPTGGGVVLQVSPFWGWSQPQIRFPGRPGYTTATTSAGDAELELFQGVPSHSLVARVAAGRVASGDTVRFVYGDTTVGGSGSRAFVDRYAEAFEEFLIKTDGDGDGAYGPVPDQPTLEIVAARPVMLAVATPAVVAPGAKFAVGVHALDAVGNLAALPAGVGRIVALRLDAPGGRGEGSVELARFAGLTEKGARREVRLPKAGLYRIGAELKTAEGLLVGANDLVLVEAASPFADILWGDIHAHSALSDGTGAPADLLEYARDVVGLDVAAVTDHDAHGLFPLAGESWETIRAVTEAAYVPGEFVTLLGYEWTSWTWGHRNVYYPALEGEVFAFTEPRSDTPQELWECIAPFGAMTIPHHPGGGPVPVDWSIPSDPAREWVVEICSIHGSSEAPNVERGIYDPARGASVRDAFRLGHRLGIIASGDTHDGHPGRRTVGALTNGFVAFRTSQRSREAVWEALTNRRVYGTSGVRILLATDWDGHEPGSELARLPDGPLVVRIVAPQPVEVVELVGPAGVVQRAYGGGRRVTHRFVPDSEKAVGEWVYVRVALADGEVAWESPFWFVAE
jgi:hypothetical protein